MLNLRPARPNLCPRPGCQKAAGMYTDWSSGLLGGESVWACHDHAPHLPGFFKTTRRPIPRRNGPPVFQREDQEASGWTAAERQAMLTQVRPVTDEFSEAVDRNIRRVALGLAAPAALVYDPPLLLTHDPDATMTQAMGEALSRAMADKLDRDILGDAPAGSG